MNHVVKWNSLFSFYYYYYSDYMGQNVIYLILDNTPLTPVDVSLNENI